MKVQDGYLKKIIDKIIDVNSKNFDLQLKFVEDLQFSEYTEEKRGFYSKHRDCGVKKSLEKLCGYKKIILYYTING